MIVFLQSIVWPCFFLLLIVLFRDAVRGVLRELPAFIRRSHYGDGIVEDVSIKFDKMMTVLDTADARDCVEEMRSQDFSVCPVLTSDGCIYGVFSIDAWVDYQRTCNKHCNVTVGEVLSAGLNMRLRFEKLPYTMLVGSDETLHDARSRLQWLGCMGFPLALLVLSGCQNLSGMITPCDLLIKSKTTNANSKVLF